MSIPRGLSALVGACILAWTGGAAAGEFAILPLRVDLGAQQRAAQLVIRNDDREPLRMQMRALRWRQDEAGRDLYEPDETLVYFPRAVEVPPGESRIVRLGIRAAGGTSEDSYRLFVTELPPARAADAAAGATVQVVLEVGVPVFVAPLRPERRVRLEALRLREGRAQWVVHNEGNVHLRAERIELVGADAAGAVLFTAPVTERYVLAGVARPMQLQVPPELCPRLAALTVVVTAEQLELKQSVDVAATQCR